MTAGLVFAVGFRIVPESKGVIRLLEQTLFAVVLFLDLMSTRIIVGVFAVVILVGTLGTAYALSVITPAGTSSSSAVRTASDGFHPPSLSTSLVFGIIPNMTVEFQTKGTVKVELASQCAVSVTQSGSGVLLWVRLKVDGNPMGQPANQTYPGIHELCGLTAGGYTVSEGYRDTVWTLDGLTQGTHSFTLDATLTGFTNGVLTGPGPGTDGLLSLRTIIVENLG